jgi:methionine sulfoxide reductase heme-binding subunit
VPGHLFAAVVSTTGPSWYWYATRGLGVSTLIVLTGTVVIGIVTAVRWSGQTTPAFVAADMHRNLSLLAISLLAAHIVTTVLDPFAHISVRDVIIPVGAAYRPVWLGFGVVATDILIAVIATSLLRERIGPRLWRWLHWAAYGSWPLAVVHGLGTGSDARAPWLIAVVVSCVVAVLLALIERIRRGPLITLPIRAAAGVAAALFLFVVGTWAFSGPFQVGWAARAGTPPVKPVVAAKPGPVHPGPGGFSDPLVGTMVRDTIGNTQISMRDTVDPTLTIAIRSPNSNETLPTVAISRDQRLLCSVPAAVTSTLYAVCGTTRVTIAFYGPGTALSSGGPITGRLDTSGPLN